MTMEDIEEEDLVTTEEAMEADMKIEEIETIQAATLILADAIEEIQTGDLLLKMILERPPQRRQRPDLSLNCYREQSKTRSMHWLKRCKSSQFSAVQSHEKKPRRVTPVVRVNPIL